MKIAHFFEPLSDTCCKKLGEKTEYSDGGVHASENRIKSLNKRLNNLIKDKKVIDIKITPYTTKQGVNGRYDEVWAMYTIMYED